jgi:hypothetical protein
LTLDQYTVYVSDAAGITYQLTEASDIDAPDLPRFNRRRQDWNPRSAGYVLADGRWPLAAVLNLLVKPHDATTPWPLAAVHLTGRDNGEPQYCVTLGSRGSFYTHELDMPGAYHGIVGRPLAAAAR